MLQKIFVVIVGIIILLLLIFTNEDFRYNNKKINTKFKYLSINDTLISKLTNGCVVIFVEEFSQRSKLLLSSLKIQGDVIIVTENHPDFEYDKINKTFTYINGKLKRQKIQY